MSYELLNALKDGVLGSLARNAFPRLRCTVLLVDVVSPRLPGCIEDAGFRAVAVRARVWRQVFSEVFSVGTALAYTARPWGKRGHGYLHRVFSLNIIGSV